MTHLLLAAWIAAQTADTLSTCQALHRPAVVEGNRLLPRHCSGIATEKAAVTTGVIAAWQPLHHARPTLANWVLVSAITVSSVAALHNLRVR